MGGLDSWDKVLGYVIVELISYYEGVRPPPHLSSSSSDAQVYRKLNANPTHENDPLEQALPGPFTTFLGVPDYDFLIYVFKR